MFYMRHFIINNAYMETHYKIIIKNELKVLIKLSKKVFKDIFFYL